MLVEEKKGWVDESVVVWKGGETYDKKGQALMAKEIKKKRRKLRNTWKKRYQGKRRNRHRVGKLGFCYI